MPPALATVEIHKLGDHPVSSTIDRRAFLHRAGQTGAAAAIAAGLPRPVAHADQTLAPFLHGVASGDPLHDRVILWTRVTPVESHDGGDLPVRWIVARDVEMTDVVTEGVTSATAERDWTVKIDPTGLAPFMTYFFVFEVDGCRSLVGRTKTAPAPDQIVDRLRFGVASCANYSGGFFNVYAVMAQRNDLDAILHLGDYLYEYGNGADRYGPGAGELSEPRDMVPDLEMVTLEEYRLRHGHYKQDPDLRRLHQLFPFIVTWDDHETTDNSHRDGAFNHGDGDNPAEDGLDWEVRKRWATRAYDEWMPIRLPDPADTLTIYRAFRYGDLADIVVLDTRLEDRDPDIGIPAGAQADDPDRRMISDAQRAFLDGALDGAQQRGTTWKIVAQQVMMMQWAIVGIPQLPTGPDTPTPFNQGGVAFNGDAWDGYQAERDRLFSAIRDNDVENVVVLTGDIHTSWAGDLTEDPFNPLVYDPSGLNPLVPRNIGIEFVTPSVTAANFEALGEEASQSAAAAISGGNPHIKMVDLTGHGYTVLDVTPERLQSDWFFVDTVLAPSDNERHHDSWYADAGGNRLVQSADPADDRPGVPAAPSPQATPCNVVDAEKAAPIVSLPATGGGAALIGLGALAGAGALRLRSRRTKQGGT